LIRGLPLTINSQITAYLKFRRKTHPCQCAWWCRVLSRKLPNSFQQRAG